MIRNLSCASLVFVLAGLTGCGVQQGTTVSQVTTSVRATGVVHGGQSPVSGSVIQLWAVGTTGYGSAATPLISATLTSSDGTGTVDSNANAGNANNTLSVGSFTITGDYTCPSATTLVYLTATGGNPGLSAGTNNSALVMMAALGQCGSLSASTFITVNEVTTVGAAYSLAPFIGASGSIGSGSDSASLQAISNAFASVSNFVNFSTGTALTTTSTGNTAPQAKLDTLANVLVACVNSTGPSSTACATLFSDATPSGGIAPTTVLGAVVDIALNPANNVASLYSIATANAAFQPTVTSAPALWNLIANGAATSTCGGYTGGGFTISGTVNYSGSKTGQIYLMAVNNSGCDDGTQGTSISSKGTYSIRGLPPGTYTLYAFMDTLGYGSINAVDPSGSTAPVTVGSANLTGVNVTLADPGTVTLSSAPTFISIGGTNTAAIVQVQPINNSNGVEQATSYTVQWSTTASFTAIAGSKTIPATGSSTTNWGVTGLTDGSVYYFRAYGTSGGTAVGPYSAVYGPVTIGAPTAGSTVSGAVTFTGAATGPLYVGFSNQTSEATPYYAAYIANPVSMQAYSVAVPNSASAVYILFAAIDQNKDGVISAGDLANFAVQGSPISVTGATANQNVTLPSGGALALVTTQHNLSGSTQAYSLSFAISALQKLPVAVTLLPSSNPDGANVVGPMDIAVCAFSFNSCGSGGFRIGFNLGTTAPTVGDSYVFNLTYNDGTTGTLVATVTGVLSSFATNLAPTTGTSTNTTPTFTWTDPVCTGCNTYTYQFNLGGPNGGIFGVPNYGSGLAPGTTSVAFGPDPTDPANIPSIGSLTLGTNYNWSVTVLDGHNNSATTIVNYQP